MGQEERGGEQAGAGKGMNRSGIARTIRQPHANDTFNLRANELRR